MRATLAVTLLSVCFASAAPLFAAGQADVIEAAGVLEQAVREHPKNSELYLHLGFIYKKLGRSEDAEKAFQSAVANDPHKAEGFFMLGLLYEKKGDRAKALAAWKSCAQYATEDGMKDTAQRHIHLLETTQH
ncbi:MAG: tetratricopeptide repeat protein [Elusimicrobia bacterium]|nr:tetratricopeptide repeat protein [Elusimicrobiota bacterium]